MSRPPKKKPKPSRPAALRGPSPADFNEVLRLIDAARGRAVATVNKELIDLYWTIGEHISRKISADGWGQGTVETPRGVHPATASPMRGASPPLISGGCGSSSRPIATSQNSQRC